MDWLPEDHLAFFILDVLDQLDLTAIERKVQSADPRGERPYSPRMMTALLLYGYTVGVFSSRKIEQATIGDVAFRVLAAGERPHFTTVNSFRDTHREALAGLFKQVLELCMSAGLVKLSHVAIDGTKMKANASKHKAMSAERMEKAEVQLTDEIEALLAKAEEVDAAEDAEFGVGSHEPGLKAEWARREGRREKIREHLAALKKEAAQGRAAELRRQANELRATSISVDPAITPRTKVTAKTLAKQRDAQADLLAPVKRNDDDDPPPPAVDADLPKHRVPTTKHGKPTPKAQRNFTDPESRIMFRDGAFLQAYNAHLAVDEENQIIVAAALSNQCPDAEYFRPMLTRVVQNCGRVPERTTADSGFFSTANVHYAEHVGVEPFIAVNRNKRDGTPGDESAQPASYDTPERRDMRALLESERGRAIYARRKATVEPVFGQIKSARGFRQISFRGLIKARLEWLLVAATHNLRKLWRLSPVARVA
jgi:transposase